MTSALHGHAHGRSHEGQTPGRVPDVARPILNRDLGIEYALIEI